MPHIQIQFRRDTSVSWSAANPILASGEMGIELNTQQFKIGDGRTRWINLPYGGIQGPPGPAGLVLPPQTPTSGQVLTYVGPGNPPSNIQWRSPLNMSTNRAIFKAAKALTNFNFTDAIIDLPLSFGNSYIPISGGISGSDTSGFSLKLNSCYNMIHLPIITGTVAFWDGNNIVYMQIKFGNSSTSNSVSATVTPTTGIQAGSYGEPLTLTIDGITSNSFYGATNIANSANSSLNYAIVIYLQLMN